MAFDNQETDIDEVTRVPNGRQARWAVLTDRTSYASILNVTQCLLELRWTGKQPGASRAWYQ